MSLIKLIQHSSFSFASCACCLSHAILCLSISMISCLLSSCAARNVSIRALLALSILSIFVSFRFLGRGAVAEGSTEDEEGIHHHALLAYLSPLPLDDCWPSRAAGANSGFRCTIVNGATCPFHGSCSYLSSLWKKCWYSCLFQSPFLRRQTHFLCQQYRCLIAVFGEVQAA